MASTENSICVGKDELGGDSLGREETLAQKPSRAVGIDLLKLIAMLLIVIAHCVQSLDSPAIMSEANRSAFFSLGSASSNPTNIILVFLYGMGALGNMMFLLCSIWFLTSSKKTKYQKIFQLLFDTFLISILFLAGYLIAGVNLPTDKIVRSLLPTLFANNWYVTFYLLLYLVHPLLNAAVRSMSKRMALHICIILFFAYFLFGVIVPDVYFVNNLIALLVMYLAVGSLQRWRMDLLDKTKLYIGMIVVGMVGYLALILVTEFLGVKFNILPNSELRYASNQNGFLLLIALGAFNLFRRIRLESKAIPFLASHTLFVYLIHENLLFRTYTRPLYYVWVYETFGYNWVLGWVFLLVVFLYIASFFAAILYGQTLGRLTKRISCKLATLKVFRAIE